MSTATRALVGTCVVALVATAGDYVWYTRGIRHAALFGVIHGAVLLTAVGAALGATSGRLVAGLPIGAVAGIAGALAYYALRPTAGSVPAMIVAWSSLWLLLAVLEVVVLQTAFARLVADRAVDRMIDEQGLFDLGSALLHLLAVGDEHRAVFGGRLAGRHHLGQHRDLAGRRIFRPLFDEAHPATRHDR